MPRPFSSATGEPPERPEDPAVRRANLRRVAGLFRDYRLRLAAVLGLIVFSAMLGVVPAFLLRGVLQAIQENDTRQLSIDAAAMIVIAIVTGVLGVWQTLLSNQVGQRVMHDLRTAVFRHLQRLSLAFFTRTRTGEVQSRISNDIGGVQNVVTSTATSIVSNVTTVIATMIGMIALSWQLSLFAFALIPVFVLLTRRVGAERRKIATSAQETLADISSLVQESLSVSGILLGKTMGRTHELADRFESESQLLSELEIRQRMAGRWMMASIQTTFAVMPAAIYWFGGLALAHGSQRDHRADARRVHDAADAAVLPGRLAARRQPRRADVTRALRPDLRLPRPDGGHRGARRPGRAGRRRATSSSTVSRSATARNAGRCTT